MFLLKKICNTDSPVFRKNYLSSALAAVWSKYPGLLLSGEFYNNETVDPLLVNILWELKKSDKSIVIKINDPINFKQLKRNSSNVIKNPSEILKADPLIIIENSTANFVCKTMGTLETILTDYWISGNIVEVHFYDKDNIKYDDIKNTCVDDIYLIVWNVYDGDYAHFLPITLSLQLVVNTIINCASKLNKTITIEQ